MKFKLTIEMDNAAFDDGLAGAELARLLREAADEVEDYDGIGPLSDGVMDDNGNTVGSVRGHRVSP